MNLTAVILILVLTLFTGKVLSASLSILVKLSAIFAGLVFSALLAQRIFGIDYPVEAMNLLIYNLGELFRSFGGAAVTTRA